MNNKYASTGTQKVENANTGTNVTQMRQYRYWKLCMLPVLTKVGKRYFGLEIIRPELEKKVNTSSSSMSYQYWYCAAPYQYWQSARLGTYIYIYFRKLRIYGICFFQVSQKRVQVKSRCCWWSVEHTCCIG